MRDKTKYDVIQMSGIDTWTSLTSGAYVLAENYLYTIEAIQNMYDRLTDGGIIAISRFAKDMETLRILSNLFAATKDRSAGKFENSVVCLQSSFFMATTLLKKGEFAKNELRILEQFAEKAGFFISYRPGMASDNIIKNFVLTEDKNRFIQKIPPRYFSYK